MEFAADAYKSIIFPAVPITGDTHLSDVQRAMLDATQDCVKILSVDGRLLLMNKAGCIALNVPEDSDFGMPWLPLLPEPVRHLGLEALHSAASGTSARFPGQSQSADGIKYWDNLLTPVVDAAGSVLSILCVSRDVTAKTKLEDELAEAFNREKLFTQEMQHRIKNVFAIVASLITISEKEAGKHDTPEAATKILREKVNALARASEVTFTMAEMNNIADSRVDVFPLVHSVLKPYGNRVLARGDMASICHKNVTTIALLLHELATNSVKYGAFSAQDGRVTVSWAQTDGALDLTWSEHGGPAIVATPSDKGFGSVMLDRIVRSAGGRIERTWPAEGLVTELHLPERATG